MLYDLTGSQFGIKFTEQTPEHVWMQTVINRVDLEKLITEETLVTMKDKFEHVRHTFSLHKQVCD